MKESAYNPTWQKNRVDLMVELMGESTIKGKRQPEDLNAYLNQGDKR